MAYLSNAAINRLNIHTALYSTGLNLAGNFFMAFLLSRGFSVQQVLLGLTAIVTLRFVFRPLVLYIARRSGVRCTLYTGCTLFAMQYVLLARVDGINAAFILFCFTAALSDAFYWMSYHAIFAFTGDAVHRGKQIGVREALTTLSNIITPLIGGISIDHFGAKMTFGLAAVIQLLSILPLFKVPNLPVAEVRPQGMPGAVRQGAFIFVTDGWICVGFVFAWAATMFNAIGPNFTNFGGALALAGLVSAIGGLVLGKFIDAGHARYAVFFNGALMVLAILLRAGAGQNLSSIYAITAISAPLGASYMPMLMTATYNLAAKAPCTLRFVFITEGVWDIGCAGGCLLCVGLLSLGVPLGWCVATSLFGVFVQSVLLYRYYKQ